MVTVVVGNEEVLDSVGPEHDVSGVDSGMENTLVWAGIEL